MSRTGMLGKLYSRLKPKQFRILIDAGHYKGSLNGTQYKKRLEYKINYYFAKEIYELIKKKKPNWYIELSRDENYYTEKLPFYWKIFFRNPPNAKPRHL